MSRKLLEKTGKEFWSQTQQERPISQIDRTPCIYLKDDNNFTENTQYPAPVVLPGSVVIGHFWDMAWDIGT
ncbi:6913_t:CDS:2 [Funneliformis geosporum]|uniref:15460_t:CDS:1 n=1 Tax=Funneliformis geosporum TaxID=1117311 RepID=A0A9W4SAR0_9GLOM|nr:15460_t:CDS:2 [Funneliformis geosporum]CAI2185873.1 6913_t:CDS:2 [Funneliformis geosporum]